MSKVIKCDRNALVQFIKETVDKKKYLMGAKVPLHMNSDEWDTIDCSGYARLLIYKITDGDIIMPDGSFYQNAWCKNQGFKRTPYLSTALKDDRLRIAFIPPKYDNRHVWLIINGMTAESWGGHGPGRRPWNSQPLRKYVSDCYVLTNPLNKQ